MPEEAIYLDSAATTRVDPRVAAVAMNAMVEEFGNAGSRTHQYGSRAKALVDEARVKISSVAGCEATDVVFTSGATESDNLSILGLAEYARTSGKQHIISTGIEHKAVLEPIEHLVQQGFDVTILNPDERGWIDPMQILKALRPDTVLVSVMQVNNETGVVQPITDIAGVLDASDAYLHVDAAQGFTKNNEIVGLGRVDLLSISGHKIGAPKGIGALIVRSRGSERPPLASLMFGGGQERGIRPGTLPVHLIAALGEAASLGKQEFEKRNQVNLERRELLIEAFEPLAPQYIGDQAQCVPNIVNLALDGVDSEAFMLATKDIIAISNGSACTSHRYEPSHVLTAMGISPELRQSAVRISWTADSDPIEWGEVVNRLQQLR
jgi:cysteine desulfurase